ncbi:hypothetical protein AYO39_02360 [Actinobacteria bacterium SCGC AG-212-D09]|nr:hypothetical protein AYO39_02360 [Actinobacteria bacterium SCGC AG-212-D09]
MGIQLQYKINGRKVSHAEWLRHLGEEAKAKAVDDVKARVARLRCPTHGKSPRAVRTTKSGDRVNFEISACCDRMLKRAQEVAVGR